MILITKLNIFKTFDHAAVSSSVGESVSGVVIINPAQTLVQRGVWGPQLHILLAQPEQYLKENYFSGKIFEFLVGWWRW